MRSSNWPGGRLLRRRLRRLWRLSSVLCLAAACSSSGQLDGGSDGGSSLLRAPPGASCDAGSQCDTGSCQGEHCCASSCTQDPLHPECTACDSHGACSYPAIVCQAPACDANSSVATGAGSCQQGQCQAGQPQPCSPYGCAGDHCASGCDNDQECASGYQCVALASPPPGNPTGSPVGSCQPKAGGGSACLHDDDCGSGLCLHNVCCASRCPLDPQHPECTTCDAQGACQYPLAVCQQGGCDATANGFHNPAICGGLAGIDAGNACRAGELKDCGQYLCSAAGCGSECLSSTDCLPGAFCLSIGGAGACCPGFSGKSPLYVDIQLGDDTGCCGATADKPCRTLANAIRLLQLARQTGQGEGLEEVTLQLAVAGDGGDWTTIPADSPNNEKWPVTLADGLTLRGPGVFLSTFTIPTDSSVDRIRATFEGAPGAPIYLGVTHNAQAWTNGGPAVTALGQPNSNGSGVVPSSTLKFANAVVFGISSNGIVDLGIDDQRTYGPVQIGTYSLNGASSVPPSIGILMSGAGELEDFGPPDGGTVLTVENMLPDDGQGPHPGIWAWNATVKLTHFPRIGRALAADGGNVDPSKFVFNGDVGVQVGANGRLLLQNATVQGWTQAGVLVDASGGNTWQFQPLDDGGSHAVAQIRNTVIRQNGCNGLEVRSGLAQVSNTDLAYNYVGALQGYETRESTDSVPYVLFGQLDLAHAADGGQGSGNRVFCNTATWHSSLCSDTQYVLTIPPAPGVAVGVENRSLYPLAADTVAWNGAAPQRFVCTPNVTAADCQPSVSAGALDAVVGTAFFVGQQGSLSLTQPGPAVGAVCP